MEGDNRLKFMAVGLILAAVVVGYFIFAQRFSSNQTPKPSDVATRPIQQFSPSPLPSPTPLPSNVPDIILPDTTKGGEPLTKGGLPTTKGGVPISQLPATGVPSTLLTVFAISAAVSGYFLRRFPK